MFYYSPNFDLQLQFPLSAIQLIIDIDIIRYHEFEVSDIDDRSPSRTESESDSGPAHNTPAVTTTALCRKSTLAPGRPRAVRSAERRSRRRPT